MVQGLLGSIAGKMKRRVTEVDSQSLPHRIAELS